MSLLFETTPQNITIHLRNVYNEEEIDLNSTCKEYLQVQKEGKREVQRKQLFYNLDAILSVGYRVNSKQGTQFRQWASARLKDYLVKGYALNQKRLDELSQMVSIIAQNTHNSDLKLNEAKGLLSVLSNYTHTKN